MLYPEAYRNDRPLVGGFDTIPEADSSFSIPVSEKSTSSEP